jgi:hypothetical protein
MMGVAVLAVLAAALERFIYVEPALGRHRVGKTPEATAPRPSSLPTSCAATWLPDSLPLPKCSTFLNRSLTHYVEDAEGGCRAPPTSRVKEMLTELSGWCTRPTSCRSSVRDPEEP